jgi:glutathione S-transferase
MGVTIYDGSFATCPRKVRWALEEKGVAYERVTLDGISETKDRDSWFRKISPKGQLPVIDHDGRVTHETNVICEYVNEAFDGPDLLPSDPWERALARRWMLRVILDIHDPHQTSVNFACTFWRMVQAEGELDTFLAGLTSIRRMGLADVGRNGFAAQSFRDGILAYDELFADMETQLSRTPWLAGDTFSLAEIGTVPWAYRLLVELDLGDGLLGAGRPHLNEWLERVVARAAFKRAVFVSGIEAIVERFEEGGRSARPHVEEILGRSRA